MDEHGHDAPINVAPGDDGPLLVNCLPVDRTTLDKLIGDYEPIVDMAIRPTRKYLPTLAELIDRLCIVMLKSIHLPENRDAYLRERDDIMHDINLLAGQAQSIAKFIHAIIALTIANRAIWDNEHIARKGGVGSEERLRLSHSINGIRNTAKNIIAAAQGERIDLKVDSLAADLPPEFGNWNLFDASKG